jgi:hypothetical protein
MRRAFLATAICAAGAGLITTGATGAAPRAASFDGSCDFSGTVVFTPAMTNDVQPTAQHAVAPGTCTGAFVDRRGRSHSLDGARARYAASSSGELVSCGGGIAHGIGTLSFRFGKIRFSMIERRAAALATLRLKGARSGAATLLAAPPPESGPSAVQQCGGSGLKKVRIDGHLETSPPLAG